jgi:glycosyltransferase involved in cell wall biosynthesis
LREYHLARALGKRAELTHVFFAQAGWRTPDLADMPFCRKIVPVPAPRRYTPAKIVRGLLGRHPLPLVNYTSAAMKAALAALVDAEAFDLVHLESIHMAAYESTLRRTGAPMVYDWHNIESEAMRRYGANAPSPAHQLYASLTAGRLRALEREILRTAAGHIVCSERERETLLGVAPGARIATIENGADPRSFQETQRPAERRRILFVGWMAYHANVKAAVDFTRAVWPGIRERFPGWRLTLAGRDPAPAVLALRGQANVEVTGTVEDIRPYYGEAIAAIVPLHSGGGTRLKILEAMAAGVPVVSTPLGAEGLAVTPGVDILIAEKDEDWLTQLNALSTEGDLWNRIAEAGRRLVTARYDWETLGQSLYETYCRWLGRSQ